MCNRGAKYLSARVAQFNMVGFVKLFRTSVARQVSRKVEPLSTSAMVATIAEVVKTRVYTSCNWSRSLLLRYTACKAIGKRNESAMIRCKRPKQNGG